MRLVAGSIFFGLEGSKEIPPITGDVEEDRDTAVRFSAGLTNKRDTGLGHPSIRGVEVVNAKEEPDPTGCLVTNRPGLVFSVCPSKQDACLGGGRADDHPALGAPVIGERRRVLDKIEPKNTGEELDGRVVLINDQSNQVDPHPGSVRKLGTASSPRAISAAR